MNKQHKQQRNTRVGCSTVLSETRGAARRWMRRLRSGRLSLWAGLASCVVFAAVVEVQAGETTNSSSEAGPIAGKKAQPDTPPNAQTCPPNNASSSLKSPGDAGNKKSTRNPVDLRNGFVIENATDVSLPGLAPGTGYAQSRNYSSGFHNATGYEPRYLLGDRWMTGQGDMILNLLAKLGNVELYVDATSKRVFTNPTVVGADTHYDAPNDLNVTFVKSGSGATELFTLTNLNSGQVLVFNGLDSAVTAGTRGRLKEQTTREMVDDSQTGVTFTYNASGDITTVTTSQGATAAYYYLTSGTEAGKINNINVVVDSVIVKKVQYTYYGEVSSPSTDIGALGDLVQVQVSTLDTAGLVWRDRFTQYRYYRDGDSDGSAHQLKAVIETDAVQRVNDAGNGQVDTPNEMLSKADSYTVAGGNDLSAYFSRSFTYYTSNEDTSAIDTSWDPGTNEDLSVYGGTNANEYAVTDAGMAKSEIINGDCASCGGSSGSGILTEYYYMDMHGGPDSATTVDQVARLIIVDTVVDLDGDGVIETGDAQYRTIYGVNKDGRLLRQAMIDDPTDATFYAWCTSTLMGTSGNSTNRVAERRMPSAHVLVNTNAEMKKFLDPTVATNDADTVENTSGVVYTYEYNAESRRTATLVQEGENGTAYYTSYVEYGDGVGVDQPKHLPIEMRTYPTAVSANPDTNGNATMVAYTFWDAGDTVMKTRTVTLPSIAASQNGSGTATTSTQYFDEVGRLRWTQDGEGYITYRSYHPDTGGLAYTVRDVDSASLPATADTPPSGADWLASTVDGASTNKPTRSGSLPTAIAMIGFSEFDGQGRRVKSVRLAPVDTTTAGNETWSASYTVYEATRTITFPRWDDDNDVPLRPIRVTEVNDAGVLQSSYAVKADVSLVTTSGGEPTGLVGTLDQDDYVAWTTYHYDDVTGQQTETRRYHDTPAPGSGAGTLSTNYDATIVQYDYMGRREYTIQTVRGTAPGTSGVEQVSQVVYDSAFMSRVIETKAGVSASGHDMTSDYDTYPTLRTLNRSIFDGGVVGDGNLTQSRSYFDIGDSKWTAVNYHRDYRGRLRGIESLDDNGVIGPYTVQDIRWDGRVTHTAVYTSNPTWATVLSDDDYAATIATGGRRALSEVLYDDLGRRYRTKSYTVAESNGAAGSYFRGDTFYDRNSRVVASAPAYSAATEMAYDGLGRQYQTRSVARLEGEPAASGDTADLTSNDYACYTGGVFDYCTPTPDPDFSDMTGTDGYVYALSHTEFTDNTTTGKETGLPTRRYIVDQNGDNQASGKVGVDFTNDDDYVVTYAYTYYDAADRPVAIINHGSGTNGTGSAGWEYGAEPAYDFTDVPVYTDTNVKNREALLATFAYDADTGRRNLVTSAIGTANTLVTIDTKTFFDDFGRTTFVAENHDDFDPGTMTTIGDGSDDSKDRVTGVAYDGLGNVTSQTAYNGSNTDDQVTEYLYEDAVSASRVTLIKYPDGATTGSDNIQITYNVDGSINTRTDQRGVVMTFVYTDRRQLEYQDATTVPAGVDSAIKSIGRSYDDLARLENVTSYDDISTGSPSEVNDVQFGYGDPGTLVDSWQNHDGAVDTGTSPNVHYQYDSSSTSSIYNDGLRLAIIDYPSGPSSGGDGIYSGRRRIHYNTLSGDDKWNIYQRTNRVYGIHQTNSASGGSHSRLIQTLSTGVGRTAYRKLDKISINGGSDITNRFGYTEDDDGYDRFGRLVQTRYDDTGSATDKALINYGYDAGSNMVYREDTLASGTHTVDVDELYGHDNLSRRNNWQLGNVTDGGDSDSQPDEILAAARDHTQAWELDQLGNWAAFDEDDDGDETFDLEQTRTANDANEITAIAATTGTNWVDPEYDAAGNMDKRAAPDELDNDAAAHLMIYDAWNRLVKITDNDNPTTIATYEYDGLGRRIEKVVGSDTFDYYHSASWQVLEVRKNGDTDPYEQFVYDTDYIDSVAIRFVDSNTDGDYLDADEGEQYYLHDASFNVIALLEADGDVLERYRYTPYGKRIAMTDAFIDKSGGTDYDQQRGFQGLLHDEESGLIENRARMLDPGTGRFVQRDSLGYPDGGNSYAGYHLMRGRLDPFGLDDIVTPGMRISVTDYLISNNDDSDAGTLAIRLDIKSSYWSNEFTDENSNLVFPENWSIDADAKIIGTHSVSIEAQAAMELIQSGFRDGRDGESCKIECRIYAGALVYAEGHSTGTLQKLINLTLAISLKVTGVPSGTLDRVNEDLGDHLQLEINSVLGIGTDNGEEGLINIPSLTSLEDELRKLLGTTRAAGNMPFRVLVCADGTTQYSRGDIEGSVPSGYGKLEFAGPDTFPTIDEAFPTTELDGNPRR